MSSRNITIVLSAIMLSTSMVFSQGKTSGSKKAGIKVPAKEDTVKVTVKEKIKGHLKNAGLFTLYQDTLTGSLQFYVKKDQLGKEFIYQSFSMGGPPELFLNQNMIRETWVFSLRKSFDKIEFVKGNPNFYYDPANAVSKAANVDVSEAIFCSEKIVAQDSMGFLISVDGLFLSEKLDPVRPYASPVPSSPAAVFKLGTLNPAKSVYLKVRSYPNNTDVVVNLAYENPEPVNLGGKDITDPRFIQVKMQHSFLEVPKNNYQPRYDDPRVGYFTQEMNDLTSTKVPRYKDVVTRWFLTKRDPAAAVSEPVEPIVWWIENTTPVEIRQTIMEAGLKWNEAFEKAGFKNAVVMKLMPDTATWDPADIRYNVIRWVSSDLGYAIGPSFINPRTGQILGADITIDFGLFSHAVFEEEIFNTFSGDHLSRAFSGNPYLARHKNCSIGAALKAMHSSSVTLVEAFDPTAEELLNLKNQFITFLILHEMGHTMGLNHNMKASQMLSPEELRNTEITRKLGVTGSVMDYPVSNISADRTKQGDYYTTKTGPYDWWAIEYGYREFQADREAEGLGSILSRSTDPQLTFGNDADITFPGRGIDPRVMIWDMSNDLVSYADDRFKLVNKTMPLLKNRFIQPGRSYEDLRVRYNALQIQRYGMAAGVSHYIGGVLVDRSFPEQKSENKPLTPVSSGYQKKAMELLTTYVFAPGAFDADAQLFSYLQQQRRGFNFFYGTEDPKLQYNAQQLQSLALNYILHPVTLQRVTNTTLYGNTYTVSDVITDLVKASFDEDIGLSVNVYRQNLQHDVVQRLIAITNDSKNEYDHVSESAAYYSLVNLRSTLSKVSRSGDVQTKAHRSRLVFAIEKALAVSNK